MGIKERIDRVTGIPEEYRNPSGRVPAPISCKIELTGRCNFNCYFCARGLVNRKHEAMDFELFKRLLLEMRYEGVREIGLFFLGEPFMSKDLERAVDFAKRVAEFPYVFLTTNGSLATPSRVRSLMLNGLDSLKFSFNYADEEQFASIARVKAQLYHKMLDNIRQVRLVRDEVEAETGHRCGLYASCIEYDGLQGERMKEKLTEFANYFDEVYTLPLYTMGSHCFKQEKERGWKPSAGNRGRMGCLRDPLPCWSIFTEAHIVFDGHLNLCCFDTHEGEFYMADLKDSPFMDGWNSEKFMAIRRHHLAKDVRGTLCEKCIASC
jgi:hypothetical protein